MNLKNICICIQLAIRIMRFYLEDACEGVYIVEPIIIYDYKLNGELVDEDTKEILTGILETTQRLNTYNCTKALLEQLETC